MQPSFNKLTANIEEICINEQMHPSHYLKLAICAYIKCKTKVVSKQWRWDMFTGDENNDEINLLYIILTDTDCSFESNYLLSSSFEISRGLSKQVGILIIGILLLTFLDIIYLPNLK